MRFSTPKAALLTIAIALCTSASALLAQTNPYGIPGIAAEPQPGTPVGPGQWTGLPGPYCGDDGGACEGEEEGWCDRLLDRLGGDCRCPRWTFSGDLLSFERTGARSQGLFQSYFTTGLPRNPLAIETFNAKEFDFPLPLSFQVSATRHCVLGSDFDLEVGYFQVDGWAADASIPGIAVPSPSDAIVDKNGMVVGMDGATARYVSSLYMGEINLRRQWTDWLNLLVGFRMGELDEQYRATNNVTSLSFRTFNHLYGFQAGGDLTLWDEGGPLSIHALCKAGIYHNVVSQRADVMGMTAASVEGRTTQATLLGETGFLLKYQFTEHLSVRLNASAAWLEGVALAPEQISVTDISGLTPTGVDSHGGFFYYGGGLGVEVQF